jgi:hypothetical protein
MSSSISEHLNATLDMLGYADSQGLVTSDPEVSEVSSRNYLWRDLRTKVGLDAAFFHDGVPLVGFTQANDAEGVLGLRKRLWNYGRVPLLIVSNAQGVDAYNATSNPITANGSTPDLMSGDRQRAIADELIDAFSRRSVEAGYFATQFSASYHGGDRVDQGLLTNLRYLRRTVAGRDPQTRSGVDALVGASLTASYLADCKVLDPEHMQELCGTDTLDDVLRQGKQTTLRLFGELAERFNGDVFGYLSEAVAPLDDSTFQAVASLLRGDHLPTGQGALWPYDFSILPPDLVSSVYEQLLEENQRRDAAYYTPRAIVDVVLDEVFSWVDPRTPTLIDLACGSGTFMTEAFRRLAYRERRRSGRQLTYPELQALLTNNIFGIDRNPSAARVAAFGLYLALLEEVDPPTIWQSVMLPKLIGTNIIISDAFDSHSLRNRTFDIIVSNPPWAKGMSSTASAFVASRNVPVANNQMAQAFVWLSEEMLVAGGRLGLVLPAKSVLHNRSVPARKFRTALFNDLDVRVVVDLSPMRRNLFAGATAPTAVVIADKPNASRATSGEGSEDGRELVHVAVHPRPFAGIGGALVISPEDVHVISGKQARSRPDIWKVLVWGALRDLDLIDRLRGRFPSLGDVVQEREWSTGQGFKEAGEQPQHSAAHLAGMRIVEIESVLPLLSPQSHARLFDRPTMHRPRTLSQYQAPQVLVRRTLPGGRLAATVLLEDAVYSSELISIAGSPADAGHLALVAATISCSLGNYWHFMTSASWGIERGTVELNELLDMPMPPLTEETSQATTDLVGRAVALDTESLRAAMDELVFDLFKLSSAERRRVREGLTGGLARFDADPDYLVFANDQSLRRYRQTLTQSLRDSLPDLDVSVSSKREGAYVVTWVTFRDATETPVDQRPSQIATVDTETILRSGAMTPTGATGMVALPAAFLIDEDTVYLVKTADSDRWSYDAALDDADRIFSALAFGN